VPPDKNSSALNDRPDNFRSKRDHLSKAALQRPVRGAACINYFIPYLLFYLYYLFYALTGV